jgi:serine/threonine protein kinase
VISTHLRAIADGMDYMQSKRICHGDLNPSNILYKVRCCCLCDRWGMARDVL